MPTSLYVELAVLIVLVVFLKRISPKVLGYIGESGVQKRLATLGTDYIVLNDVYLANGRGSTSQIDHVVVSQFGVFVVETKNYSGIIRGKDTDQYWTVVNYKRKDRLRNPFHQNYGHVQSIKAVLAEFPDIPITSIVVFADRADLKVDVRPGTELVYSHQLVSTIKKYHEVVIPDEKVEAISQKLRSEQVIEKGTKRQHVKSIKSTTAANKQLVKKDICPRCGGQLVMRRGKYGSFKGCSNFPKCRFIDKGA